MKLVCCPAVVLVVAVIGLNTGAVFLSEDSPWTITAGTTASVTCGYQNITNYTVYWEKEEHSRVTPGNETLIFQNVQVTDHGNYSCVIEANDNVLENRTLDIRVSYPSGNISISVSNRVRANYTISGGANATLECSVDGFPPPFITWRKDGAIIKEENLTDHYGLRQPPTDGFISVFDVINAGREDSGTYVCTANNSANQNDSREAEVHLAVPTYPPRHISISVDKGVKAKYTIPGGANATLVCSVDVFPPPFITWRKDGDIIKEENLTDRYGLRQPPTDGFISVFDVINAGREDSGTYVCTANNSANQNDSQEAEVHLAVPNYFPVLQNQGELSRRFTVVEGESIVVNFTVVSSPRSLVVKWSLQPDGSNETSVWSRSVDNSLWNMRNRTLSTDVQLFQFYHVNVTENMTGLYRVILTNGLRRNLDLEYSIGIGYDTTGRSINATDVYSNTTDLNLKDDEDYESTWKILLAVVVGVVVTNVLLVVLLSFCIRGVMPAAVEHVYHAVDESLMLDLPVTEANTNYMRPFDPYSMQRYLNRGVTCMETDV
ncbi:hemicentin-1-like [Haliotis rufescens]|uniref:hemicentin-1-like n=1 Tax=Haliotis rufescens TaxID=6454 RepID=UPI00201EA4DB|nr:hemicentin-1-like [Haliotis rufescens]